MVTTKIEPGMTNGNPTIETCRQFEAQRAQGKRVHFVR